MLWRRLPVRLLILCLSAAGCLQGPASAVGCFKTQMVLYWLALAQAGLESPAAAGKALLYGAAG